MQNSKAMGIGPMGEATRIHPRMYRFLFTPDSVPELESFVASASVKYFDKTIDLKIYETQELSTQMWIEAMARPGFNDAATLTVVDGCGVDIYKIRFTGVRGVSHNVDYAYEKSDIVTHGLVLDYDDMKLVWKKYPKSAPLDKETGENSLGNSSPEHSCPN